MAQFPTIQQPVYPFYNQNQRPFLTVRNGKWTGGFPGQIYPYAAEIYPEMDGAVCRRLCGFAQFLLRDSLWWQFDL